MEGYGDLFLEKGLIPPEPDAGLFFDVPRHLQKGSFFEVHGEQPVVN